MRSVVLLLVVFAIVLTVVSADSSNNNLSEEDKIITNLSKEHTIETEVARIKDIRNTQIKALIKVIKNYQQSVIEDKERIANSAEAAINLLGELRAAEAVETLINFMCFLIDHKTLQIVSSTDYECAMSALQSSVYYALPKIGKPVVEPLIILLMADTARAYFPKNYTEKDKNDCIEKEKKYGDKPAIKKRIFARKTLYLIEGECAIHHLEKVLNEEPDKTKKDRLAEAIAKFKEELKSGAYK